MNVPLKSICAGLKAFARTHLGALSVNVSVASHLIKLDSAVKVGTVHNAASLTTLPEHTWTSGLILGCPRVWDILINKLSRTLPYQAQNITCHPLIPAPECFKPHVLGNITAAEQHSVQANKHIQAKDPEHGSEGIFTTLRYQIAYFLRFPFTYPPGPKEMVIIPGCVIGQHRQLLNKCCQFIEPELFVLKVVIYGSLPLRLEILCFQGL